MKLNLTTYQRIMCVSILGDLSGDVKTIRKAMKALDKLEFTREEQEQINLRRTETGFAWDPHDHRWEIEINDEDAALVLKQAVSRYDRWHVQFAREVIDLTEQLGISDTEKE